MKFRILRWGEYVLLIGGFLFLGYVGFEKAQAFFYQSYESYKLDQVLHGRQATITSYLKHFVNREDAIIQTPSKSPIASEETVTEAPAPKRPLEGGLIGRVDIPRLNISVIVKEGVDDGTLSRAVGHVSYTPLPGEPGNVGIAAHRDTYFRNMRNIKKGDRIWMVTPKGNYEYEVDSLKIVMPTNVEVLDPTPEPAITLITCYPFDFIGSAPKRFIVRAKQITDTRLSSLRTPAPL